MKYCTAAQMRRMDQRAQKFFGIPSIILMENAALACVDEIVKKYGRTQKRVAVFCGKGNNGGDGFAIARHLWNRGWKPTVYYFQKPKNAKSDPATNLKILKKLKLQLVLNPKKINFASIDLVVDALFGTGLSKNIEKPFFGVIQTINASRKPVVAVDIPSGLNTDTGEVMGIAVRADLTVTFGFPKKAFALKKSRPYTGRLAVRKIGLPDERFLL